MSLPVHMILARIVGSQKEKNIFHPCPTECRFNEAYCHACWKIGHTSRACRSKAKSKQPPKGKPTHHLSEQGQGSSSEDSPNEESAPPAYSMFTFGHKSTTAYKVNISINGTSIDMEIDTGASLSVISEATYAVSYSEGKVPPL